MLKNALNKMKNVFKNKSSQYFNNEDNYLDSDLKNMDVKNNADSEIGYFGSEEYKLEMLKSELRYELIPKQDEESSLQKEYVRYVEEKLSLINMKNKDEYLILTWNEWLTNELNSSYSRIAVQ